MSRSPAVAQPSADAAFGPASRPIYTAEIAEAARRFGFAPVWLAAVLRAESGGDARALSPKGAMGLMQVMPETYAAMRATLGLGADPWRPLDNILAGAGYLRALTDRYGATAALAAYNAGPGRYEAWVRGVSTLPAETRIYIEKVRAGAGAKTSSRRGPDRAPAPPPTVFIGIEDADRASTWRPLGNELGDPVAASAHWGARSSNSLFVALAPRDGRQ